jgi:hypothetical protein
MQSNPPAVKWKERPMTEQRPKESLDQVRGAIRLKPYSDRTEQ